MPFLLITGMHRSGTSFLARALNLHGVNLGELDSLLSHEWKAFEDNPRGHWENKKIYELAEKTLKHSKGSWHKVPKKIVVTKKIGRELKKCINEIQKGSILSAGFKDPRLLICFKQWKKYLPKNFVVIGIIRNPLKVAESIKKRDGFSYEKSLKLWKIYNQNLLEILGEYGGFLLDVDWPKKKLFKELEMISKKLDLAPNIDLSDWYSKDLLKSDKTYKSNYVIPTHINALYSKLKARTRINKNVKIKLPKRSTNEVSRIVGNLLTEIHNQSNYFTNVFSEQGKELKQKKKSLTKIQKEFDDRSSWSLSLDKELKQKNKSLTKKQVFNKNSKGIR